MTLKEFFYTNRPTIVFFIITILNITFLTSDITSYLRNIRAFFVYFLSSVYIPASDIVNYPIEVGNKFVELIYMKEENIKLKQKIEKLYFEKIALEQKYKNVLDIKDISGFVPVYGKVLNRNYSTWYNYFLVSFKPGSKVEEGAPVVVNEGKDKFYFIGRIWSVEGNIGKVLLITDPLSAVPVKIKDKPIRCVMLGNATPEPVMEYILLEDKIKIGDIVVSGGLVPNIPENLEIGRVKSIDFSSKTGFKFATISLHFNINNISDVIVLTK